jgi:hypothetical protein
MSTPPVQTMAPLPGSRRTSYQFPAYRWIGWLAVAGFAIGLTVMFFISGLFGIPAPLGWAALVILFSIGTLLLDRPRLLLTLMMFYFLLMPGDRLFGLVGLPLPGFIDELFFLPFIAVIVMNWIQRRQLKEATFFPIAFCAIAALSWYVNGKPSPFTSIQVTLIMLKFYILWYFCRLTSTFETERQLSRWTWGYIVYAAIQYLYNILWHRSLWLRYHPDRSGGVFGPDTAGAHLVGYLSVFTLLLLAGWWISSGARARPAARRWAIFLGVVIGYNLVFMTDTKHALILLPFAFAPLLFHPNVSARLRAGLVTVGAVFILATYVYFKLVVGDAQVRNYFNSIQETPKAEMFYAVTADFSHLVPYPLLGAGPGRFASNQGRESRAPLARRYIIPYYDEARRLGYFGRQGTTAVSSVVGSVNTDFFVLMGEFGWAGAAVFYGFIGWIVIRLFRKSAALPRHDPKSGAYLGLASCVLFLIPITMITSASTVPPLMFPLWMLIGRAWDMKKKEDPAIEPIAEG